MRYLIDYNIVIPLEPSAATDFEVNTSLAMEFNRLTQKSGHQLCVHPATHHDIDNDKDKERAEIRRTVLDKYIMLESVPGDELLNSVVVGSPARGSNSWVDNQLLAALAANVVDVLVTEDVKMHRKAARLGLGDRTLYLGDAIATLKDLFDEAPPPPPAVDDVYVYELDTADPFFDSLRTDYEGFDDWLDGKCKPQGRKASVIRGPNDSIAGLCIRKKEDCTPDGRTGKTLKLCTFKVCEDFSGNRYGELLLKATFKYARANDYAYMYFTVFPRYMRLTDFARDFGFFGQQMLDGEYVMVKELVPPAQGTQALSAIDFHIKYGPYAVSFSGNTSYIVPIRADFHAMLFPECESQQSLIAYPCGNSIKKAYLSSSSITTLARGDNLFFYRIGDLKAITAIGVIEAIKRSYSVDEIAGFVGTRTVFSYNDIRSMCSKQVLAVNFRLARILEKPVRLYDLVYHKVIGGAPQSIGRLRDAGWLKQQVGA